MGRGRVRWAVVGIVAAIAAGTVAEAGKPQRKAGEKYALLVGVKKYSPNELRGLPYTEADVTDLAAVLKAHGYDPGNIVLMTQAAGVDDDRFAPRGPNVRRELGLLLGGLEESDGVLVAFAGHGVQFKGDPENYFCPSDAKLADKSTLIPLGEVYKQLEASGAGMKVLLVDACRNDPQTDNSRSRSVVDLANGRPLVKAPPGGVVAFFSCSAGEKAYEHADLGHGVFFHFVIEGLKGAAVPAEDREVLVPDLEKFVKRKVRDFVRAKYGELQRPELRGATRDLVPLVSLDRALVPDRPVARPAVPSPTPESPAPRRPEEKAITNSIGMKLVPIPAGEFEMGSDASDKDAEADEKPRHHVRITRPFYLGATEVTQGQYRQVTGANPSEFKGSDDLPVERVSWNDAIAFCNKLSEREGLRPFYQFGEGAKSGGDGYRLPTEAEWEYACRGSNPGKFGFGDDESRLGEFAWFGGNSDRNTHPVGGKSPNAFGLFDMHGNVWEWCGDYYDEDYYATSPSADPSGPLQASGRVFRGGSWLLYPRYCRSARRNGNAPGGRSNNLGFRVARVRSGPS